MSQPNGQKKHVADHHPSRRSLQTPLQTPREVTSLVTERGYISTTILPLSSSHQSIHPSISYLILSCNIRQDKIYKIIYGWMDGRKEGWMDGCMDGWMEGRKDGRTDGCMDGWMEEYNDLHIYLPIFLSPTYLIYVFIYFRI